MAEALQRSQGQSYENTNQNAKEWSYADIDELRLHCETGGTVNGAATLLYRTFEDVRQKAVQLRLIK